MYAILVVAVSLLVSSVFAALGGDPNHIFGGATCNADSCLRAIDGNRKGPSFAATVTENCSAFLRTTVTPSLSLVFHSATEQLDDFLI
jgi:hypothetical protein